MSEKRFSAGVALFLSLVTLFAFVVAYNTPPLSGPFCAEGCFQYPYLDITSRFPRDYYWMFPAMIVVIAYLILMICIKNYAEKGKQIFGQIAAFLASISSSIFLIAFFTQLAVVQPSLLRGEADGISLITQFNPHGLFIAMEELGFLLMSLSFLFAGLTFGAKDRLQKWIKWIFISSFILTILSLILISINYGIKREYLFEVAAYTFNWLALIINGFLLFKFFSNGEDKDEER